MIITRSIKIGNNNKNANTNDTTTVNYNCTISHPVIPAKYFHITITSNKSGLKIFGQRDNKLFYFVTCPNGYSVNFGANRLTKRVISLNTLLHCKYKMFLH